MNISSFSSWFSHSETDISSAKTKQADQTTPGQAPKGDVFEATRTRRRKRPVLCARIEQNSHHIAGQVVGMHAWGAERSIKPTNASFEFNGGSHYTPEANFQLMVSGPVTEPGYEGRKGYFSLASFNFADAKSLPPYAALKEGLSLSDENSGSTLNYSKGVLTLKLEEEVTYGDRGQLTSTESYHVEMTTSPDLRNINSVRYVHTSDDGQDAGGWFSSGSKKVKTDVTITKFN